MGRGTVEMAAGARHRRSRLRAAGALAVALAVAVLSPSAASAAGSAPGTHLPASGRAAAYIVRARPGGLPHLLHRLHERGVDAGRRIELINAVAVRLPAGLADQLRSDPSVLSVTPDATVSLLTTTYDPATDVNSLYNVESLTGVRGSWRSTATGAGVDVALVDSGVTPVVGLADPGKVVHGPDLTPESMSSSTNHLDTYGHGTFMAGIIAGHDPGVDPVAAKTNPAPFLGVAPNARIVSVKVADAHGNSDVSQVIAGIDWVVQHAHDPGLNIRVLNLSFGTNSTQAYTLDPLAYAVEVAWRRGIVVVTSAGNSGNANGRLTDPAIDPFVIAVGADDLNKTASINDDTIPDFSSRGDGVRNPDVLAPGAHIQSLRVPGSYIDVKYASTGAITDRFFRGSGTSQAAAFVSGCVAMLLQSAPSLTPDQVKLFLRSNAKALPSADAQGQGKGLVDMRQMTPPTGSGAQTWTKGTGTGSLEAARGTTHVLLDGKVLTGEKDIMGTAFNASTIASLEAQAASWNGNKWNGATWIGAAWNTVPDSWSGSWSGGSSGSSRSWESGTWTGRSWADTSWSGSSWNGLGWSGGSWLGRSWADNAWS